ncbi:MAG: hypothetical protein ACPGVU_23565 [Limisphaerales bacterium]
MSDEMSETPPWSRFRWLVSVLLILLLHLGLLFAVSDWKPELQKVAQSEFSVRLYTEPDAAGRLLEAGSLNDPTLLASVGAAGFSGPAWMNVSPPPFKLPEWTDEERWLTQNVSGLGGDFRTYIRTNLGTTVSISKPTPPPPIPAITAPQPDTGSRLFVVGQLSSRQLLAQPALPPLPAEGLLNPTEVEVLVNDKGYVFSPRLHTLPGLRSPDQIAADNKALELVPKLRFAPGIGLFASDKFPFTKGRLIFQWDTVAPPSTNQPAAK